HSVVLATDTEHYSCLDPNLVNLASGTDVLIYDAMYTEEEYAGTRDHSPKTGWGHSTWEMAVKVAQTVNARKLVLFHHDPDHDDETVSQIEAKAQEQFPGTIAAREGLLVQIS
ncbi:MAG: MBL fold metallo-hydrolase, partial [Pseudomonadota bacterium]